ncbi:putative lipoprotein [Hyphomonas neptunium ATCC 15444]|uniref:Putative lipoprotein n=2 Tax=Hyphomonas TaxID=85 RepID=Q0BY47_HYPNA|nr:MULTISPECIES: ABC-type transport auxiliary lipoprotein family protein [Hyphomonas]ABI76720.1 putative lipoprotein [Hyphomonas neptunium ATCC 15444]KCZ88826.1 putative lipoprotein [Hyphomonas hirschiana VP5]
MFRPLIQPLVLAAALALSACAGIIPQRDPANALYRIGPLEPAHQLSASVTVREPEASRLLAGRFMSAEDETGAIRYVRSIQWSDRSTSLMQEAVLDLLNGEGGNVALPAQAGAVTEYEFSWRISDLTLKGNTARCRLEGAILKGRERSIQRQTSISTSATASGNTDAARAQALVEAGQACAGEAAAFIAATALPEPEPESETPAPQ